MRSSAKARRGDAARCGNVRVMGERCGNVRVVAIGAVAKPEIVGSASSRSDARKLVAMFADDEVKV